MALSNWAVDGMVYIEQMYWETGEIPTDERIAEIVKVEVSTVNNWWKEADFRNALASRGIVFDGLKDTGALTMPQLLFANMLLNGIDKRSMREKLKDPSLAAFNITPQQVSGWMRSPAFQTHLKRRAAALYGQVEPIAYAKFVQAIEAGDQSAIKLFFEIKGIYNPRVQVDLNITGVLVKVIEIVSRHVGDPDTLQAIADDIDLLELGPRSIELDEQISAAATPLGEVVDVVAVPAVSISPKTTRRFAV